MSTQVPQGSQDVVKAFKKRKLIFQILWYAGCIALAVGIISYRNTGSMLGLPENIEPWLMIGSAVVLFLAAMSVFRCPVCGNFFWWNTKTISCGKCKTAFLPESKRPFW